MSVSPISVISYVVAIVATVILSAYFFREYERKKLRASLAWGVGFGLYFLGQITDLYVDLYGAPAIGKAGLMGGLTVVVLAMVFLYYGTSLLFFSPSSFFREKMSVLLAVIYIIIFAYATGIIPVEGFKEQIAAPVQLLLVAPIFFAIAILFYRVSTRLAREDPRRSTILLVSAGWGIAVVHAVTFGLLLGTSAVLDTAIHSTHAISWILILYGMVLGRAARV